MIHRPDDSDRAADLLERLLTDPGFRRDFRRDPAAACTAAGMGDLAAELRGEAGSGAAFQTLEVRESKSALAGMVIAAAAEGIAAVHVLEHLGSQGDQHAAGIAHSALTRASVRGLPAVQGQPNPLDAAPQPIGGAADVVSSAPDQAAALASQVLADPHVHLSQAAEMAFSQRGVDPRVDSLLLGLSQAHQLTVGSVSGPGTVSIVAVDGMPVSASNIAARDVAEHLANIDPSARPSLVSTPWNINGSGFSSGADHSGHIEVSYDAALSPDANLPGTNGEGQAVVHEAARFLGKPYVWGGESPNSGFDCSGLVQYSYRQLGVDLPRTTFDQIKVGHAVEWGQFQPGDLIFSNFEGPGAGASHVVIYAGHGEVIAAPHTGGHVEYEPVSWFKDYFVGARRVIPGGGGVGMRAGEAMPADAAMPAGAGAGQGAADSAMPAGGTVSTPVAGAQPLTATPGAGVRSTVQFMPAVGADHAASAAGDVLTYPGDGASHQQIAEWMATAARKAGLPPELPVMAALVESGLKNDPYGDRDSLGFFQMRTSIWDEGPYKGFAHDPDLQLKWFIDQAVALKQRRISEGYAGYGSDPSKWGDWVADIERPAEQYRGRYQLQLGTAQGLLGDNT